MKPTILLVALSLCNLAHAADAPVWYGDPNCRIAEIVPHPQGGFVKWSGACKDGYADGKGALEWSVWRAGDYKVEAVLVHGEISGGATMTGDFGTYIGTFRRGNPDGQGYFKYASGKLYEGGVVQGKREGAGIFIELDRSRYEGQWKNDERNGYGKQAYALGGSYEGEWKDDKFDGKGVVVHAGSGRRDEALFKEGRVAGSAPAVPAEQGRYSLNSDEPRTGSHIAEHAATGYGPLDATWEQLTPGQQNLVKSFYQTLDDGDDPPYPLHGTRKLYADIIKLRHIKKFRGVEGRLLMYVRVGKDGKPQSVTGFGKLDPEFVRYAGSVLMLQEFKPASCHGEPCEMNYPINFSFEFSH